MNDITKGVGAWLIGIGYFALMYALKEEKRRPSPKPAPPPAKKPESWFDRTAIR